MLAFWSYVLFAVVVVIGLTPYLHLAKSDCDMGPSVGPKIDFKREGNEWNIKASSTCIQIFLNSQIFLLRFALRPYVLGKCGIWIPSPEWKFEYAKNLELCGRSNLDIFKSDHVINSDPDSTTRIFGISFIQRACNYFRCIFFVLNCSFFSTARRPPPAIVLLDFCYIIDLHVYCTGYTGDDILTDRLGSRFANFKTFMSAYRI